MTSYGPVYMEESCIMWKKIIAVINPTFAVVPRRRVSPPPPTRATHPLLTLPWGGANFSYISLQNMANRLNEKQKVGSARGVTYLAESA